MASAKSWGSAGVNLSSGSGMGGTIARGANEARTNRPKLGCGSRGVGGCQWKLAKILSRLGWLCENVPKEGQANGLRQSKVHGRWRRALGAMGACGSGESDRDFHHQRF